MTSQTTLLSMSVKRGVGNDNACRTCNCAACFDWLATQSDWLLQLCTSVLLFTTTREKVSFLGIQVRFTSKIPDSGIGENARLRSHHDQLFHR